jgi:endonuclease/exonuclease/phosphatase family metal-dependent hydrolase
VSGSTRLRSGRSLLLLASLAFALPFGAAIRPVGAEEVKFAAYNIENYLRMDRSNGGKDAPKPEAEIEALLGIIRESDPDILGVCEIGDRSMFEDLLRRLNEAGLRYEHSEYVGENPDPRHLALFSRYPIVARNSAPDVPFELNGTRQKVRRGFLDATVRLRDGVDVRFLGVHLKSKRPVPEGEALVRRHEAQLLRKRIDGVLEADPEARILVYGDMNDSKNEPPIHEIAGRRGSERYMADLWVADDRGERWTYYWKYADHYSRIDYLFASPALRPEIVMEKSYISRPANWSEASDHCLIVGTIDPDRGR